MQTVFDWLSILVFGCVAALFLHRSIGDERKDTMLAYVPPALGCAVANYFGNHGMSMASLVLLIAVTGYVIFVLKPFSTASK